MKWVGAVMFSSSSFIELQMDIKKNNPIWDGKSVITVCSSASRYQIGRCHDEGRFRRDGI